jgi:hypothetical protein
VIKGSAKGNSPPKCSSSQVGSSPASKKMGSRVGSSPAPKKRSAMGSSPATKKGGDMGSSPTAKTGGRKRNSKVASLKKVRAQKKHGKVSSSPSATRTTPPHTRRNTVVLPENDECFSSTYCMTFLG